MERVAAYKVEQLRSWDEFTHKIAEGSYEGWAFRGQSDRTWRLISTLGRDLKDYVAEKH